MSIIRRQSEVICKHCNSPFTLYSCHVGKQLYCTRKCFNASKWTTVKCRQCGVIFNAPKITNRICCSRKCACKYNTSQPATRKKIGLANINRVTPFKFRDTSIEIKIEEMLKKSGIAYQKQVGVAGVANVDFYLPSYRTVIECDGCYWHACPIHFPTSKIGLVKRQRDIASTKKLQSDGFRVIRLWEHEINAMVIK